MSSLVPQLNDIGINSAVIGILAETSTADVDAVIQQNQVAPAPVEGSITAGTRFVMVPKAYTSPSPVEFTLSINASFSRTGILSRFGNTGAIDILKPDGTVLQFNGQDNEFSGLQLQAGVRLFARGVRASGTLDDYSLTLDLAAGPTPVGPPVSLSFTAVELLLDICVPRTGPGGDPPALSQPTGSGQPGATDKWFGGRLVNEQDGISQERAMLIVRQPRPAAFNGRLQLRGVAVSGTTIGALSNKAQLFSAEIPITIIEQPFGNPHEFSGVIPANGIRFFVQGNTPSAAVRDMGFQLGFAGGERDGDRVAVTVGIAPVIVLASDVVVVKKSGLNPARKTVTLRTSSTFGGTGTLSRSGNTAPIKLFRSNGSELTFTPNPVFTDIELQAGVQLAAEGIAASGAIDDYILTLTLTSAGTVPAGRPVEKRMTAVELTLDVALSRTAPGVDPPIMPQPPATPPAAGTATDKINLGRFVQVRDPGFTHERAMLIVRQPNPPAFNGTLVLTALSLQVQAFRDETPAAGQTAITPMPFEIPRPIPASGMRLFVEGTAPSGTARLTGFDLGIRNVESICDRVSMTVVQVEVADAADPAVAAATFVRMGLWDNAFRPPGNPLGLLFNQEAEADNFVGADTRKFHIRVRDAAARNTGSRQADWITLDERQNDDDAPATRDVTLVETAANPGVFVSRGLMLVSDTADQNQATHTGLAAPLPDAGLTQGVGLRNHRTRKATVRGFNRIVYRPAAGIVLPLRLPIFQRTPETRRRLPIQIFVLRLVNNGPNGVVSTAGRDTATPSQLWTRDIPTAEETFARLGIELETVIAPTTPAADVREERPLISNENVPTTGLDAFKLRRTSVLADPRNRIEVRPATGATRVPAIIFDDTARDPNAGEVKINRSTGVLTFNAAERPGAQDRIVASYVVVGHRVVLLNPGTVNPLAVRFQNPVPGGPPLDDEATLATNSPSIPNTIRVYYTGGLPTQGAAAESWPPFNFSAKPQVGCSFISVPLSGLGTLVHELGHVLTNKSASVNTGHYRQPVAPPPNRFETPQNLMANQASPGAPGATIRKRLWDVVDADGVVNQFTAIRGSTFTRGF